MGTSQIEEENVYTENKRKHNTNKPEIVKTKFRKGKKSINKNITEKKNPLSNAYLQ